MEFKKCLRCGCFFMAENNVCCNCEPKDKLDLANLNSFLEENHNFNSIQDLSIASGINVRNLNRFIADNKIPGINLPNN